MRAIIAGLFLATSIDAAAAVNPQIDMAAVQKWSAARTARYHVEGVFQAWTQLSQKWSVAQGDATDTLTVDFDWSIRERKLVGDVKFDEGNSSVKGVRSATKDCPAPELAGTYEHIAVKSVVQDAPGRLAAKGIRAYAAVKAPLECPASQEEVTEYIPVPDPMMLAVGATGDPNVTISPDHRSFIVRSGGWTWTLTPTSLD